MSICSRYTYIVNDTCIKNMNYDIMFLSNGTYITFTLVIYDRYKEALIYISFL